jgi:hypothetical protein
MFRGFVYISKRCFPQIPLIFADLFSTSISVIGWRCFYFWEIPISKRCFPQIPLIFADLFSAFISVYLRYLREIFLFLGDLNIQKTFPADSANFRRFVFNVYQRYRLEMFLFLGDNNI